MAEHGLNCSFGKDLAAGIGAGNGQPAAHVILGLLQAERFQMAAQRDALFQLPQFMRIEYLIELGLAREHDLQQFLLRGLEIGQEPNFFQ